MTTLLDLVETFAAERDSEYGDHLAADATHAEIARRLAAVEQFKGTEASKIKAILNGEDGGA